MVFDVLSNFRFYETLHPHLKDAANFLDQDLNLLTPGRYEINQEGCFANVDVYNTKDISQSFIEYHKKYIDVQLLIEGKEKFGFCNKENCEDLGYDVEKDLGKLNGDLNFVELSNNNFIILFPQDGHTPQLNVSTDTSGSVKKLVIKIPIIM